MVGSLVAGQAWCSLQCNHIGIPKQWFLPPQACYIVNDAVRELWPEVDGRSKDYILNPKANQYQSLHITVEVGAVGLKNLYIEQGVLEAEHLCHWGNVRM